MTCTLRCPSYYRYSCSSNETRTRYRSDMIIDNNNAANVNVNNTISSFLKS